MQDELSFEGRVKEVLKQSYAASNGGGDTACAIAKLKDLSAYPVTVLHLSQTGAGAQLAKLSKDHPDSELREAAKATVLAWRSTITTGQLGDYLQQRANVSIPSSSCAGLLPMFQAKQSDVYVTVFQGYVFCCTVQ